VDVRATTTAEQHRVDSEITKLSPAISGTEIKVEGRVASPPLMEAASRQLFALAGEIAKELELGRLEGVQVGGGSDGNYTAAVGAPTLDGLGAVGDGAHAEGEHVFIPAMPERAALVARLIEEIRSGRGGV
jgi:glutamate carboxypeptidase